MPRHLVIGGAVVTTVPEVYRHYAPAPARITSARWQRIRPLVVAAVQAAHYPSIHATHFALRVTSGFVAWCDDQGLPLDPEVLFLPDRVERHVGSRRGVGERTRGNERAALRRVGRAVTRKAPWPPEPKPFTDHVHLAPPYSADEVAGFRAAAADQATAHRKRVLTAMLVLGLGAGLKPRELLTCTASQVRRHALYDNLWVIATDDRFVPLLAPYTDDLLTLCRAYPDEPLVGRSNPAAKDPFAVLRRGIEIPRHLPSLRVPRLRTTWMATVLSQDLRLREFMQIAGTVSSKSLECVAPYVPARWADDLYLLKAAGLA